MVSCPNCGNKIEAPDKVIENSLFHIAAYTCKYCGHRFKVSN